MKPMVVNFEQQDDVCILRLEGRFATGQDSHYLRTKAEELKSSGRTKVVADFSQVSYIDSTGIGFLIAVYTSLTKDGGGSFVLAGPNLRVRQVLQLTKLNTILNTYDDVAAAVAAVK